MLKGKNASGWVLALVAVGLFGILLIRGLSRDEATAPNEQASAGVVMAGNERTAARDFSTVLEAITAQSTPVVVKIYPTSYPGTFPKALGDHPQREDLPSLILEDPSQVASFSIRDNKRNAGAEPAANCGCGVLVSNDGYILTNHHILASSAASNIKGDSVIVVFNNGRKFMGIIVGTDPLTDLGLVKISAKSLRSAKFGDSDGLRVGQWVLAIGNAMDHSHSVTAGIISAKGRSKVAVPQLDDFIRMDAAIHAGNSGGALVNLEGELVGLNTALFASSTMHSNGYAIPSNLARRVMQSLMKDGRVIRGFIGVVAQDIDESLAKALQLNSATGALLVDVTSESPAEESGLRRGDVVLQLAGEPVRNAKDLQNQIAWQLPGQNVPVVVWRDSVKMVCEVMPEEWPTVPTAAPEPKSKPEVTNKIGIHIRTLAPNVARRQNLRGVMVSQIDPGCPVAHVLLAGDIIQEINRQTINSVRDFKAALQPMKSGETALLLVRRGEKTFFVGVDVI